MSTDAEENKNYQILDSKVNTLERKIDKLERLIESLGDKIDTNTINTSDLVDAWKSAKGLSSFVKWLSTLALGCGVLWAALHSNFKG